MVTEVMVIHDVPVFAVALAGWRLSPAPRETSPLAIAAAQQVSEAMAAAAHIRMQRKTGSLKRKIQVCLEGEQNKKDKKN